ncbi:sedoheptulokinase-like isoform X3 [Zootermopsis nevadensis]|uniref:sedoheptulokinase-like isoform X3 n=1 Tax=Zootermopsis nevadensis TaxID=136037 RepID=UPI000B8E32A4|nr:sedoheptulokinase-like isoform X3 [Zootermopsis nevadensis]
MAAGEGNLILGIDIGTTSVKVCLVDPNNKQVLSKQTKDTQANVPSDLGSEGNKQDVPKIISALNSCVSRLPKDQLKQVGRIGICGQMHGVMLWSNKEDKKAWDCIETYMGCRFEIPKENVSALYTWQDTRCERSFLDTLPVPQCHLPTYSGYGCATLFWITRNRPDKLERYNRAGTVQDFAVAMLCNLDHPIMSVQNAAGWGYFNTCVAEWNSDILQGASFPTHLLPHIVKSGAIAGTLDRPWYGIPSGTSVGAALGDLQCSVLATMQKPDDAVLNISTSAQLAYVMPPQFEPNIQCPVVTPVEYFPYFDQKYLAVAASLNGGNALAAFVCMLQHWTHELGFNVTQSKIWDTVLSLGGQDCAVSSLRVVPTLLGERHVPEQNASILNVDPA